MSTVSRLKTEPEEKKAEDSQYHFVHPHFLTEECRFIWPLVVRNEMGT